MKCQCENAFCNHVKSRVKKGDARSLIEAFQPCKEEASHTVLTHRGKFKMCDICAKSARDFATHIYKGV
jgi:hypothetical protein